MSPGLSCLCVSPGLARFSHTLSTTACDKTVSTSFGSFTVLNRRPESILSSGFLLLHFHIPKGYQSRPKPLASKDMVLCPDLSPRAATRFTLTACWLDRFFVLPDSQEPLLPTLL